MSQASEALIYPVTVQLAPQGPAIVTLTPNIAGLPLDTVGDGNYFAFSAAIPLNIISQTYARPFLANVVNFLVNLQMANTGGAASGIPSPSALTCSASISTITNGVIAAVNGLNLASFNALFSEWTDLSTYEFQGSLPLPQPLAIDLLSPYPTLNLIVGVQMPVPIIGGIPATPGTDNAAPQVIVPAQGFTTGVQIIGNPTRGSVT